MVLNIYIFLFKPDNFVLKGSQVFPQYLKPEKRETIWTEEAFNPGPHAPQVTTLTTRPWLLVP